MNLEPLVGAVGFEVDTSPLEAGASASAAFASAMEALDASLSGIGGGRDAAGAALPGVSDPATAGASGMLEASQAAVERQSSLGKEVRLSLAESQARKYLGTRMEQYIVGEGAYLHAHEKLGRAEAILDELIATLNMEAGGDVAVQLDELYTWITGRILKATADNDTAPPEEAAPVLAMLRESWVALANGPAPQQLSLINI